MNNKIKLSWSVIGLCSFLFTIPYTSSFGGTTTCVDNVTGQKIWVQLDNLYIDNKNINAKLHVNLDGEEFSGIFEHLTMLSW